jgi:hypothetical protein
MSDAWPIIALFVFIFALWVATGGPTRPISFAGPFITPLTTIDDTQSGYGSGFDENLGVDNTRSSSLWSVKSIFGRFEGTLDERENVGIVSPHADSVTISSGAGGPTGSSVRQEYVTLSANSRTDITGWRLVSTRSGAEAYIPQGTIAPTRSAALTNIVLEAGDEAVVTTGSSPSGTSFRENMCVGYLGARSYTPALSGSCPDPLDELGNFYTGSPSSYDTCRETVSQLPACTNGRAPRNASASCEAFIEKHLSYQGCVDAHFNEPDFRGDTWRIFLGQSRELWRSDHETIKLLDREGRTVDIYSY